MSTTFSALFFLLLFLHPEYACLKSSLYSFVAISFAVKSLQIMELLWGIAARAAEFLVNFFLSYYISIEVSSRKVHVNSDFLRTFIVTRGSFSPLKDEICLDQRRNSSSVEGIIRIKSMWIQWPIRQASESIFSRLIFYRNSQLLVEGFFLEIEVNWEALKINEQCRSENKRINCSLSQIGSTELFSLYPVEDFLEFIIENRLCSVFGWLQSVVSGLTVKNIQLIVETASPFLSDNIGATRVNSSSSSISIAKWSGKCSQLCLAMALQNSAIELATSVWKFSLFSCSSLRGLVNDDHKNGKPAVFPDGDIYFGSDAVPVECIIPLFAYSCSPDVTIRSFNVTLQLKRGGLSEKQCFSFNESVKKEFLCGCVAAHGFICWKLRFNGVKVSHFKGVGLTFRWESFLLLMTYSLSENDSITSLNDLRGLVKEDAIINVTGGCDVSYKFEKFSLPVRADTFMNGKNLSIDKSQVSKIVLRLKVAKLALAVNWLGIPIAFLAVSMTKNFFFHCQRFFSRFLTNHGLSWEISAVIDSFKAILATSLAPFIILPSSKQVQIPSFIQIDRFDLSLVLTRTPSENSVFCKTKVSTIICSTKKTPLHNGVFFSWKSETPIVGACTWASDGLNTEGWQLNRVPTVAAVSALHFYHSAGLGADWKNFYALGHLFLQKMSSSSQTESSPLDTRKVHGESRNFFDCRLAPLDIKLVVSVREIFRVQLPLLSLRWRRTLASFRFYKVLQHNSFEISFLQDSYFGAFLATDIKNIVDEGLKRNCFKRSTPLPLLLILPKNSPVEMKNYTQTASPLLERKRWTNSKAPRKTAGQKFSSMLLLSIKGANGLRLDLKNFCIHAFFIPGTIREIHKLLVSLKEVNWLRTLFRTISPPVEHIALKTSISSCNSAYRCTSPDSLPPSLKNTLLGTPFRLSSSMNEDTQSERFDHPLFHSYSDSVATSVKSVKHLEVVLENLDLATYLAGKSDLVENFIPFVASSSNSSIPCQSGSSDDEFLLDRDREGGPSADEKKIKRDFFTQEKFLREWKRGVAFQMCRVELFEMYPVAIFFLRDLGGVVKREFTDAVSIGNFIPSELSLSLKTQNISVFRSHCAKKNQIVPVFFNFSTPVNRSPLISLPAAELMLEKQKQKKSFVTIRFGHLCVAKRSRSVFSLVQQFIQELIEVKESISFSKSLKDSKFFDFLIFPSNFTFFVVGKCYLTSLSTPLVYGLSLTATEMWNLVLRMVPGSLCFFQLLLVTMQHLLRHSQSQICT